MTKDNTHIESKLSTLLASFLLILAGWGILFNSWNSSEITQPVRIAKQDRMDLAIQQEVELTKDPRTGIVPRERLIEAWKYTQALSLQHNSNKVSGAIPGVSWTERGPWQVAGRTRTLLVDPNDVTKKRVFAGSVGGGLWKTDDITVATPVWNPVNDLMANLAVTTIAAQPSNPQIIYFGTGEGYFNADAIRGEGIFKSTNGGTTWTQLTSTFPTANFQYVQKILVHPITNDVYAATRAGVFRSQNGGTSWTKVLGSGTGASTDRMADIEIGADNMLWVAAGIFTTDGIYSSTTGNAGSWTKMNTGGNGFPTSGFQRIELATAPSDADRIYAVAQSTSAAVLGIYKSTDKGATWTTVTLPTWSDGGEFSRGQAWYDLTCAVDPNNADVLLVGGVDLFKSTTAGSSWTQISQWYGGYGFQNVHADQHLILFEPGNSSVIYFGNDGGIFRSTNGTATTPSLISKNQGYRVTQYYGCAMHPSANSNHFLAGAQDNGSQRFSTAGMNTTVNVSGGDGCFTHIDQDQPQYQWTSYVYNSYYRSTNGGASFSSVTLNSNTGSFVNPTDYDNAGNVMYCGEGGGTFRRWTNPQTGNTSAVVSITGFGGAGITHVSSSPNTPNLVFFGLSNGRVVRVDDANTIVSGSAGTIISTGMPGGSVSCIAIEEGNDDHLLVTYSNYGVNSVWRTTNGGTSWTSVEGNLPDMPVRWAIFNPNNSTQAMIATELGVWTTDALIGSSTNWAPSNTGMANVRTDMLQYRTSDKMVIASTHGRGLYSTNVFAEPRADFYVDKLVTYVGKPLTFTDASSNAVSYSWNFGDATTSVAKDPAKTYNVPGQYTVTLTINSTPAYTETKTAYVHVLPNRGTPYNPAAGGNFETNVLDFGRLNISGSPFERGSSATAGKNGVNSGSNAWVSGLSGNYLDLSESHLYTPAYNLSLAGTYSLRFYTKYKVENGWDGFRVEYSLNKGDSWTLLGNVFGGWYDFANTTQTTSFPINEPYFNVTNAVFTLKNRDISFLAGNTAVAFRFVFKTDESVTDAGIAIDDFEITGPPNAPLPVSFGSITGTAYPEYNQLKWFTYSERNNSGFEVQRSENGLEFSSIGFVNGNLNSSSISHYTFDDKEVLRSLYYYRLRQVDVDGKFDYSSVIFIRKAGAAWTLRDVYPNPARDKVTIIFTGKIDEALQIKIYNATGKLIQNNSPINKNKELIEINISDLSSGVYILKVESGSHSETKRIVKY